jgi:hypothetical protein
LGRVVVAKVGDEEGAGWSGIVGEGGEIDIGIEAERKADGRCLVIEIGRESWSLSLSSSEMEICSAKEE